MSATARSAAERRYVDDVDLFGDSTEKRDATSVAAGYARAGMRVFPVLRSADPTLDKRPVPGYRWLDHASDRVGAVVEDFVAAVVDHGEDRVAVGWALGLDGYCAVDDDHDGLPAELAELLDTPHAVNITAKGSHRIWRQPNGLAPNNSTARFPVQGWGELRGVHGYIVLTGADRPGFDADQLAFVSEFPRPDWLTPAGESVGAATSDQVRGFLADHAGNDRPRALEAVVKALDGRNGARHSSLTVAMPWALRDARAGLYPAFVAVKRLHAWWRQVMDDPRRCDGPEFAGVLSWAVAAALAESDEAIGERRRRTGTPPPHVDPDTGEARTNLPDEFWTSRLELAHIRQAAHSRMISADAVLGAVLARIAMLTPPGVRLPAIIGSSGTLDLIVGIVAPPGVGKSSSMATARELVPTDRRDVIDGAPLGSGEGIAEAYLGPAETVEDDDGTKRRVRRQAFTAMLAYLDEGQALAELAGRRGSTLLTTLRTAWSGGRLGQANASADTHRVVHEGRYRFALVIAWQPAHAAAILDDAAGGTPQRFLWLPGIDPTVPDTAPPWPGRLAWAPAPTITGESQIEVPSAVAAEITAAQLPKVRGTNGSDSAHDGLARLKVAALLAALDGHPLAIVDDDWRLAAMITATSARVQTAIVDVARTDAHTREQIATERAVRREGAIVDSAEARSLANAARAVARYTHSHGKGEAVTRTRLRHAIAGRDRNLVDLDAVLDRACAEGWITADGNGFRPGESRPT